MALLTRGPLARLAVALGCTMVGSATVGCTVPDVDIVGRPCPCPEPFVCTLEQVCAEPDDTVPRETACDGQLGEGSLLCEGFENPGANPLAQFAFLGAVGQLSPGRVGRNAGWTCVPPTPFTGIAVFIHEVPPPLVFRSSLYWRAWVFLGEGRAGDIELLSVGDVDENQARLSVGVSAFGQLLLSRIRPDGGAEVLGDSAPGSFSGGEWACLQVGLSSSDEGDLVEVSVGQGDRLVPLATWRGDTPGSLFLDQSFPVNMGVAGARVAVQTCAVFDEIVISESPIGPCDP